MSVLIDTASHVAVWNDDIESRAMTIIRTVLRAGGNISISHTYGYNQFFDHSDDMIQFDFAKRHFFMSTTAPFTYWMVHKHIDKDKADLTVVTDKVQLESIDQMLDKIAEFL